MNLWQWLLIPTPDGATYLQAIILVTLLILMFKFLLIPMAKDVHRIWTSLGKEGGK